MPRRDDAFHRDRNFDRDSVRIEKDATPSGGLKGAGDVDEHEHEGNPTSSAIGAPESPAVVEHDSEMPASSEAQLDAQGTR